MKKFIKAVAVALAMPLTALAQFGVVQPLHVEGNQFKDPYGNKVVLHGVMDTPSPYFNSFRWGSLPTKGHIGWTGYTPSDPSAAQYVWQIVNPRPDEEVDFVEITSPLEKGWHDRWGNKSSLAIVAVTVED